MALQLSKAAQRPLGSKMTQPLMLAHDIFCYHTIVGSLVSADEMFHGSGYTGTESHLGVGGKWGRDVARKLDGKTFQWVDMRYSADANYLGSRYVLSVETADNAASPIQAWSGAQVQELIRIGIEVCSWSFHRNCPTNWACRKGMIWKGVKVGIPPIIIPDTKLGRRGLAVHRQGCEHSLGVGRVPGYLAKGGVRWSKSRGKVCPDDARVAQFKQIIVPGIQRGLLPARPPAPKPTPPKPTPPRPAPKPPVPAPPAPPAAEEDELDMYIITIKNDPAQFLVGANGPGDVQHLETTDEVARFKKLGLKSTELEKDTFLRIYAVGIWEDELPETTQS